MLAAGTIAVVASASSGAAQSPSAEDLLSAVVQAKTYINPDGRTVKGLGQQRSGSGAVIDDSGLIVTIGYLMVEAHSAEVVTNAGRKVAAEVVGYDHDTGFGLLRATEALKIKPLALGKSADLKERDQVLGGEFRRPRRPGARLRHGAARIRRLLGDTSSRARSSPHRRTREWSGAALVSRDGKLVGIGSLVVGDVTGQGKNLPRQHVCADRSSAADWPT